MRWPSRRFAPSAIPRPSFFRRRGRNRWEQAFAEMSGYGADGTDDQLDRVVNYFQRNLTVININTWPVEDLQQTLQVSD